MPAVPQNIINDATQLILSHIRQTSQYVEGDQPPAPGRDGNGDNTLRGTDEEIYAAEETLKSLNTQLIQRKKERNSLIRFNQLPLEIASNILWLSIIDPWQRKISLSFLQRLQAILSVCSSWRTLVESTPKLWSIIEFSSPQRAISHLLQRSESRSLEIKCFSDGEYKCMPDVNKAARMYLALIAPHWHRVRSLILYAYAFSELMSLFENPAPLLEELELKFAVSSRVPPLDLFCGQAERLEEVTLENIQVRWDSGILVGLRSLKIKGTAGFSPKLEQVRRLMEANPELEKMNIEDIAVTEGFGHEMDEFIQSGKWSPVVMRKVREIKLFSLPLGLVEAILGNIEIPSIRHLDLKCLFQGSPAYRLWSPNLKHIVPPVLKRSNGTQLAEVTLGKGNVGLAIYLPRQENPTIRIQLNSTGRSVSGIEWLVEKFLREDSFLAVAAPEIFQVSLKFGDNFDMERGAFIHVLDQLRAVKVKSLTTENGCRHGEELIKYLGEVQENSQWPLPHLMSLTIAGPPEMANHLSVALEHRKHGAPTGDTSTAPRPVSLEVLNIEGLNGVERKVESALAKYVSSSGTFIRASRRTLAYWDGYGDDWEDFGDDNEDEDI